jgi:hypothetical protein
MSHTRPDVDAVRTAVKTDLYREANRSLKKSDHVSKIFKEIVDVGIDVVRSALGDLGGRVYGFAQKVDYDHPDLSLVLTEDTSQLLSETLKVTKFSRDNKYYRFIQEIRTMTARDLRIYLQELQDPRYGKWVRMLKEHGERASARSRKEVVRIELNNFYKTCNASWPGVYDSFLMYVRHNDGREKEIARAQQKADRFGQMGCILLQSEINKAIAAIKQKSEEDFLGFRRITLNDVALILAKVHGYELGSFGRSTYGDPSPSRIKVHRSAYAYSCDQKNDSLEDIFGNSGLPTSAVLAKSNAGGASQEYEYGPRAYPYAELAEYASADTKKMIDYLEALPEAEGKPVFDHFIVVVPCPNFPVSASSGGRYEFVDSSGSRHVHKDQTTAIKAFCVQLLKEGSVAPVIVGERDGKCYFLSYWS